MNLSNNNLRGVVTRRRLTATITLALLSTGAPVAGGAATHTVTNCNDSGAGSLRSVIVDAATMSGDTVDFASPLGCSKITLTSGEIAIPQSTLSIQGPSLDAFYIDGNENGRVFHHSGAGTLTITDLTVEHGFVKTSNTAFGGCVASNGSVVLVGAVVEYCAADAQGNASAFGGGVFTGKDLTLSRSTVSHNVAVASTNATTFNEALGGGVYVAGYLLSAYSSVSNNSVSAPNSEGRGGGMHTNGKAAIVFSTIAGNHADQAGAWYATTSLSGTTAAVGESTISGNTATNMGGILSKVPLSVEDSTIAFNVGTFEYGGLYMGADLTLNNVIIADNEVPAPATPQRVSDLGGSAGVSVSGSNSLVTSSALALPAGTLIACPKLGPLVDNGGPTLTHAILHNSPAIDHGKLTGIPGYDQRGVGFPRLKGATIDIGAFEWQGSPDDRLFTSRFEKSCDN